MVFLGGTLLVAMAVMAECQVFFPIDAETKRTTDRCTANNGEQGTCHEYRSAGFQACSWFFPSIDTNNEEVANHLRENSCPEKNTDFERFFCCPFNTSPQPPTIIPDPAAPRNEIIPSEDECGSSLRSNVVGGEATEAGDWPWLAAIGQRIGSNGFIPFCGATLITKQHVISAAHCFNQERSNTIVRLGEYNTSVVNAIDKAEDFTIADRRMADYNRITKENDLILLKLDRPIIVFKDSIRPACLPYHLRNEPFEGETLMVVGWGKFDVEIEQTHPTPLLGKVPVVPLSTCRQRYNSINRNTIDDRQMCAGVGGTDSCNGDSGGPLNYLDINKGRFYLVGAVSWGPRNCGDNKLPGVYARIGSYLGWIEDMIREMI